MPRRYLIRRGDQGRFRVDYDRDLDPEQQAVVTAPEGPALVVAGAGSGKTRAVTYRVARLLESEANVSRILLLTFTNKAAREMLGRVDALVSGRANRVWGGTFHSIASRLLRRHAEALGYQPSFTILDSEDAADLIDAAIADSGIDVKARRFPRGALLADLFTNAVNRNIEIPRCLFERYPHFEPLTREIELVHSIYRERKLARNAMDYDDLLVNCKRLLAERVEIAEYWSDQFRHILVDEYQDTNRLQAEIVDLLAATHRNLLVVGDDAQAIFGWRGAQFENIYLFRERYPDAREYKLERNYRSRPEILMVASASIRRNVRQFPKNLRPTRPSSGVGPALVPLCDVDQQAAFVASRVLELREEGTPLGEIAVLYRSHWQSIELQLELVRRDIPYFIRSGVRFFEQAHIKDVISYLRLVVNPRDELAWKRTLRLIPGVGKNRAARIWAALAESKEPLATVAGLDSRTRPRHQGEWNEYLKLLESLSTAPVVDRPSLQIELVLGSGYAEYLLTAYKNPELRAGDLKELARLAQRFDSTEAFLSELALLNTERLGVHGGIGAEEIVSAGDEDEKMVLSTIHQAKGLEWRVVFLIWAAEGKLPSARSFEDEEKLEEERRLFYVAATRAIDDLILCYPLLVYSHGRGVIQKPSRFITEVPVELFEIWSVDEEAAVVTGGPEAATRVIN
jgi:DNA helicase-2/ATP-dependent DNA helicase PcrA